MIFLQNQITLIRDGRKTQTRLPALTIDGRPATGADRDNVLPCLYGIGRVYQVQHDRKTAGDFKIQVTETRTETLGAITDEDAVHEGFVHALAHQRAWRKAEGGWNADTLVWVVVFEPAADPILLLGKKGGYTDKPHLALGYDPLAPSGRAKNVEVEAVPSATQSSISAGELRVARAKLKVPVRDAQWDEDVTEQQLAAYWASAGRLEVVRSDTKDAVAPVTPRVSRRRPSLHDLAEDVLRERLLRHEGRDPDEIHILEPKQGTPGEIRKRRRDMGLRQIDGLPVLGEMEMDRVLAHLVSIRASVRTVAFAMDWSHGKAQRYLADQRHGLAA